MSKNTQWLQAALKVAAAVLVAKRDLEVSVGPVTFTRDSNGCIGVLSANGQRLLGQGQDHLEAIAAALPEVKP